MEKTLKELAKLVGGKVYGDGEIKIRGIAGILDAEEGEVTFLANIKYLSLLKNTKASAVIISPEIKINLTVPSLLSPNPYLAFTKILQLFYKKPYKSRGISKSSFIGKDVILGKELTVYPFVYIGDRVKIGNRVTINYFPWGFYWR
jgi:UDP-3-O-[3-hydroxymyristoyl] glucosamine N-acyltransferase